LEKTFLLILLILCFLGHGCAEGTTVPSATSKVAYPTLKTTLPMISPTLPPVQPQPVEFCSCNKFFKFDSQKLFYLTLAGVNANRFTINEIQSKSGYILFSVGQKQFLARVINIDAKNSMLKITPCDNIYFFPIGIVQNMFKYVELNANTPVEKLSIL
jgi:hypothetical protein